jgi:hypothetical protein
MMNYYDAISLLDTTILNNQLVIDVEAGSYCARIKKNRSIFLQNLTIRQIQVRGERDIIGMCEGSRPVKLEENGNWTIIKDIRFQTGCEQFPEIA